MGFILKNNVISEAKYIINTNKTIRDAALELKVSKSVLHRHLSKDLKYIDNELYLKVKNIFLEHTKVRHINGGIATKMKYAK